jgi:heterotetrameric sarcosine oxidase gamma subunit
MAVNTGCALSIRVSSTRLGSDTVSETTTEAMASSAMVRSPFEGHVDGAQASAAGQVGVHLRAAILPGLLQISTWPSGCAALRGVMAQTLGAEVPTRCGQTVQIPAGLLMCTGPEEYQLLTTSGPSRLSELRQHIAADVGSVTDLGHARCRIRIEGPRCLDTLSKLFALDLREAAWPVGELRLTGHHHVPCSLLRLGDLQFDLFVFTTYAYDQLATILDAAREFGVALELGANTQA